MDKLTNSYKGTMSTVSRAKAQSHVVIHPLEIIEMIPEGSLYNLRVLPKKWNQTLLSNPEYTEGRTCCRSEVHYNLSIQVYQCDSARQS
jgi:hypothetical protein